MSITQFSTNYYSIPDILVTQEKIPCKANTKLRGMGTLDPSFDHPDVNANESLELPLWYALYNTSRSHILKFQVPEIYRNKLKDICEADALAVDLGRLNKFFYMLGKYIVQFDRTNTVAPMLYETCRQRFRTLVDLCQDITKELKNSKKFDFVETELYNIGCETNEKFRRWYCGKAILLRTPSMVSNHQKRRRALVDSSSVEENTRLSKSPRL